MKIITITLNPAIDIHCNANGFKPFGENFCETVSREAGGKGINISRALKAVGVKNTAIALLGEENADDFLRMLSADDISPIAILTDGRIRENLTLHTDGKGETRISFSGSAVDASAMEDVLEALERELVADTAVTFSGSIPTGICVREVKKMLKTLKNRGAKLVIDSRSLSLEDVLEISPWLIKPNEDEIRAYTDVEINGPSDALTAARRLRAKGIENVMISLGERGAVLSSAEGDFIARAPKISAVSTIGAGDSSIAGFIAAASSGSPSEERLARAVAFGSAACLGEGTRPPSSEDIERLLEAVSVEMKD